MKTIHKSILIWFSPQEMYGLVTDVEKYAQFLPWCDHARILENRADGMTTEIGLSFGGVHQTFSTRNTHVLNRRVDLLLLNGPFSRLDGHWGFHPVGDVSQRACKVELTMSYGFDSPTLDKLVGPVFDKVAASLIDAFVARAQQVYGD